MVYSGYLCTRAVARVFWGLLATVYLFVKKKPVKKVGQEAEEIVIRGARTHNLKNIDVRMPRNTMIVVTGISGSGKSTLAFDTIFAEGRRLRSVSCGSLWSRSRRLRLP